MKTYHTAALTVLTAVVLSVALAWPFLALGDQKKISQDKADELARATLMIRGLIVPILKDASRHDVPMIREIASNLHHAITKAKEVRIYTTHDNNPCSSLGHGHLWIEKRDDHTAIFVNMGLVVSSIKLIQRTGNNPSVLSNYILTMLTHSELDKKKSGKESIGTLMSREDILTESRVMHMHLGHVVAKMRSKDGNMLNLPPTLTLLEWEKKMGEMSYQAWTEQFISVFGKEITH